MIRRAWIAVMAITLLALPALVPATTAQEADADEGQALYLKKCAMCHGKDGVAKKMAQGSANLNDPEWQKATSLEQVIKVTTEGQGKMPKYDGKLTPEQIKLVATYVKSM